jgi:hypothetical protein
MSVEEAESIKQNRCAGKWFDLNGTYSRSQGSLDKHHSQFPGAPSISVAKYAGALRSKSSCSLP